jgi:hypothetical protein
MSWAHKNKELAEKDIKNAIPFTITTKYGKSINEKYKCLIKEIEKYITMKGILHSWIARILLKYPYYSKESIDLMEFLWKY